MAKNQMRSNSFVMQVMLPHFGRFENEYYWFGLLILFRRFLLAVVTVIVNNWRWQLLLIAIILVGSVVINQLWKPYRYEVLSWSDSLPMTIQVVVIVAMLCHASDDAIAGDANSDGEGFSWFIVIMVVGTYICAFFWIFSTGREYVQYLAALRRKDSDNTPPPRMQRNFDENIVEFIMLMCSAPQAEEHRLNLSSSLKTGQVDHPSC